MTFKAHVTLLSEDGKTWVVDKRHFVQTEDSTIIVGILNEFDVLITVKK